ncbi:alpha/beta fold hydrolase [Silvibacterium acidisoli]|uniref:alpha/beta fold hydrolase n=1 Tax=Acidobacteriaceae bacterium ZG23-2 TaxID=2883246 RepID=UPI00406C231E
MAIVEQTVTVDGVSLHLQIAGSGSPLILLHGLIGSGQSWRQNIEFLAGGARVYAVDLFNMGKSERVIGLDASLQATADRLIMLMDELGLDSADIAAHSHGGAIAMMLAARHPDRVRKLILFAPANPFCRARYPVIRFFQTRFGLWLGRRVPKLPRAIHEKALARMYGDPSKVTEGTLETYTEGLDIPGTMDHVLEILGSWFEDMRQLKVELSRLAQKPALLIWGDLDRAVNLASGQSLSSVLTRSELLVLPGAGHLPFEEMPEVCNLAMREWLAAPAH